MKLFELAFACRVYTGMTVFDKAYQEFLDKTFPDFDMQNASHRTELLIWLNAWGCRIPEKSFEEISEKLLTWFGKYERSFPQEGKQLLDLSDEDIVRVAEVYKGLLEIKFIGDTCASKILFALRRDIYPIWDDAMREKYGNKGCSTYKEYMKRVRSMLLELKDTCNNNKIEIDELPDKLNIQGGSLLKLLDEYQWIVMTKKLPIPSVGELQKWCEWNSEEPKPKK